MIQLGPRIRQLRNIKGWSQHVVAKQLGMSQANYHKIESDKADMKLIQLEKIAQVFEISVMELIDCDKHTISSTQANGGAIEMSSTNKVTVLFQKHLQAKDDIIKLQSEKIAWLEHQVRNLKSNEKEL